MPYALWIAFSGLALSFFVATITAAVTYGELRQEVRDLKERVGKVEAGKDESSATATAIASLEVRFDERTGALKEQIDKIERSINNMVLTRAHGGLEFPARS